MAEDLYTILGVDKNASDADIKRTYRKLAHKYHPDKNKTDREAEKKFKEINMAYEVLSDREKRQKYDQFGAPGLDFDSASQGFSGQGFDFSDFSTGFGDIFETFFGGGMRNSRKEPRSRRGSDIEAALEITFEEAAFGTAKDIKVTKSVVCDRCHGNGSEPGTRIISCTTCHGTGEIRSVRSTFLGQIATSRVCESCGGEGKIPEKRCSACHGSTRVRKTEDLTVKIPEGIDDGATIRMTGKGEGGLRGGSSGDLYLHIRVKPSSKFTRKGIDISSEKTIHLLQSILGDEISVETIHGPVTLKIPAGTQSQQVFKLVSRGIKKLHGTERGDHYVRVIVEIPKKLSKRERELYMQLAQENGLNLKTDEGILRKLGL